MLIIIIQPAESCQEYPVTNYSIMLQNDSTDAVRVVGPFAPSGSGKVKIQLSNAYGIVEDAQYNFSIMAANRIGIITSNKTECCELQLTVALFANMTSEIVLFQL